MVLHLSLVKAVGWWEKYAYKSEVKGRSDTKEEFKCRIKKPQLRRVWSGLLQVMRKTSFYETANCYVEQRSYLSLSLSPSHQMMNNHSSSSS
jgi:hypothetical protein